jgi:hypothetical protein
VNPRAELLIREYPARDAAEMRCHAGACPGAELFVRDDGQGGVVLCLDDGVPAAAAPPARRVQVLFTGGRYGIEGGEWLFYVGLWTPAEFREEFLAWYELEHLPILLECPTWDGCRFVERPVDHGAQFHALHQLADKTALESAERSHSRATPWFRRLSVQPWFDGAFTRTLCRRVPA